MTNEQLFEYIVQYKKRHDGNSPTMRQMSQALSLSLSTIFYRLGQMEKNGLIRRKRFQSSQIEVVGGEWKFCPHSGA